MPTDSDRPSATAGTGTAPREVLLDEAGHLAESLSCRGCGYDLKGIAADGVCPECTSAVDRSIRGDLLQFCDPAWLDRLRQGLLLIFFGIISGTVAQIGIMIAAVIAAAIGAATGGASRAMTIVMVTGGLVTAIVALVNVIGAWLVTTQDPGRAETEAQLSVRNVARFAIMASLVSAPMQMVMAQAGMFTGGSSTGLRAVDLMIMIAGMGAALLALVGWVAFYIYARQVVLRVPLEKLARQLRVIVWGYAISTIIALAFGFVLMLLVVTGRLGMPGSNTSGGMQVTAVGLNLGSCASVIAFMIFEIWAAVLFLVLRKRLTVMVAEGRER